MNDEKKNQPVGTYLESGFNQHLVREFPTATSSQRSFLSDEDFNSLVEGVSGSKINSGISRSAAGDLTVNWDKGLIELIDGSNKVVQIGKFEDGTKGIRINSGKGHSVTIPFLELEMGAVVVPGQNNTVRLYVDNGGTNGKNRLMAQFFRGSPRTLATEP